jgi:hypothetical protein
MNTPWDSFIDTIERRKHQLDEVLEAYKLFRQKLDSLPPGIAQEAERMLAADPIHVADKVAVEMMDLVGKPALECIRTILKEHNNQPIHFSQCAKEALKRGYKGRSFGTPEEIENRTAHSFWAAMSRADDLEAVGKGCYRLKTWPQ